MEPAFGPLLKRVEANACPVVVEYSVSRRRATCFAQGSGASLRSDCLVVRTRSGAELEWDAPLDASRVRVRDHVFENSTGAQIAISYGLQTRRHGGAHEQAGAGPSGGLDLADSLWSAAEVAMAKERRALRTVCGVNENTLSDRLGRKRATSSLHSTFVHACDACKQHGGWVCRECSGLLGRFRELGSQRVVALPSANFEEILHLGSCPCADTSHTSDLAAVLRDLRGGNGTVLDGEDVIVFGREELGSCIRVAGSAVTCASCSAALGTVREEGDIALVKGALGVATMCNGNSQACSAGLYKEALQRHSWCTFGAAAVAREFFTSGATEFSFGEGLRVRVVGECALQRCDANAPGDSVPLPVRALKVLYEDTPGAHSSLQGTVECSAGRACLERCQACPTTACNACPERVGGDPCSHPIAHAAVDDREHSKTGCTLCQTSGSVSTRESTALGGARTQAVTDVQLPPVACAAIRRELTMWNNALPLAYRVHSNRSVSFLTRA